MTAIYKQRGDSINHIPSSDISAGDVVVQEDLVGIAKLDIQAGQLGGLALTGIYDIPKATGSSEAITVGTKVYWDEVEGIVKADSETGANKYIGKVTLAASDDDESVLVRLEQ